MTVLVMDDAAVVRERIVDWLSEITNVRTIIQAGDTPAALKLIDEYRPHVLILDIQVPGDLKAKNGIDVLKWAKKRYPASVVIMLTNFANRHYREECQRAGAEFFFDKSREFDQLPAAIETILKRR